MLNLGKETRIKAMGKTWTIGRLELAVIRDFKAWIMEHLPPTAMPRELFESLPREEQVERYREQEWLAKQLACFSIQGDLAKRYLATEEGLAAFGRLLLRAHHPDVTDEEAFQVFQEAGPELARVMQDAAGEIPEGNGRVPAAAP